MSGNATVDRLRAQAQQYGLASDYTTAKALYQAVDEIERLGKALEVSEEQREERERVFATEVERLTALLEGQP